ncbi:MAG: DNA polymerase III subunit alpha [Fimbriimonadaceae bacterium]
MDLSDPRLLAWWRETGEWWRFEPVRETVRYLDSRGVRREVVRELPPVAASWSPQPITVEDRREDVSLRPCRKDGSAARGARLPKTRDEKVSLACGAFADRDRPLLQARRAPPHARGYAALHVLSGYAFGRGAMLAEEVALAAAEAGVPVVCLADPFSLMGAFEFALAARKAGVRPLIGASFEMPEGGEIALIARTRRGYESLSRLITDCHLEEPRLYPLCSWERLERHARDLICLTGGSDGFLARFLIRRDEEGARRALRRLADLYGADNVAIEVERSFLPWEASLNRRKLELADASGVLAVAGGPVTHARPSDFPAQDVLACIETLCTIEEVIGRKPQRHPDQPQVPVVPRRAMNAERYLRSPAQMAELYADRPELLEASLRIAERCDDDVLPGRTRLPSLFPDPVHALREITYLGACERHGRVTEALRRRLDSELERIGRLRFADHFLIAWDAARWAREQGILLSGRGSVVDSAVAYCLGLSRIDAFRHNLHFDRFLPEDGSKRPDIDIDFEAARRDEVRDYLARKYGEDRVATVAAFGAYCSRGIVRGVGKVFGLPEETIGFLAKRIHGGVSPDRLEEALEKRPELRDSGVPKERFRWVFRLAGRLMDIPQNVRAHSSGVVISAEPIACTVPVMRSGIESVRIIQWDKRSAKHCFDKFDLLCLRGHDVLAGTQERVRLQDPSFRVEDLPLDDPEVYRTMRSGHLIGIPQSASPAMRQAHVRMRTENLHDASLVQAGIRPGVGGAVKLNELIARRRGLKPYAFEHPEMERILGLTYGIVVFQEQVDQLLQTFCGYKSGEAEDIRDAIYKRRREDFAESIRSEVVRRVVERGFGEELAARVYDLVAGFKGYGFAQGHALAFAEISIRSIYCQQNLPAPYFAALLNAQPAGYYGPCTIANEARCRGVAVLGPDVNFSGYDFEVEDVRSDADPKIVVPSGGVRVGLRQVSGISEQLARGIVRERANGFYDSVFDFCARLRPNRDELERLVLCGAFDRMHPNRRAVLWAVPAALDWSAGAAEGALPLLFREPELPEVEDFSEREKAILERRVLGMDVRRHLMAFERGRVRSRGGLTAAEASRLAPGTRAFVVGNPIRLRFPPTRSGRRVLFFDLEDETGLLNVTVFEETYQRDGHAIVCSPYATVLGEAQDRDGYTAFLAHRVFPYRPTLAEEASEERLPVGAADFLVG